LLAPPLEQAPAKTGGTMELDDKTRTELEAGAFRKLVAHLRERTDVQNLDLMNLAGFCRNCLSRWYRESAEEKGLKLPDPEAREAVYGMPYDEWKKKYQKEATKPVDHKH
jgi:uncharacterized protein